MSESEIRTIAEAPDIISGMAMNLGGKASGLEALQELGMNVPSFFVVPSSVEDVHTFVGGQQLEPDRLWAVRSSANVEDGKLASYAGQFETLLAVETQDLPSAIHKVRTSRDKGSASLALYTSRNNISSEDIEMHVVVQEFIEPDQAGVWIGTGDGGGILEWVSGRGSNLVDGTVSPSTLSYPVTGEEDLEEELQDGDGNSIGEACLSIEDRVGYACDIEFCIKDGILYYLQLRPATVDMSPYIGSIEAVNGDELSGQIASKGVARAIGLRYDLYPTDWEEEAILVAQKTSPEDMHAIMTAAGIITQEGGKLSHAAVVSREFGIPCIVGVDIERILHKSRLELDANVGQVSILSSSDGD